MNTNQVSATIAGAAEMALGSMRMVRVGSRRVALVRTSSGFHALDNACPHEGYGLVQGALDGEVLTCEWHNWKFAVADGTCVLGEENVASHRVQVVGDDVVISVEVPTAAQIRLHSRESLLRGIDAGYSGQIARDALRMLHAGASPLEIVWEGVARTAPRTEYGFDHAFAMTADCLAALGGRDGDDRLTPVVQALSAMAEECLRFPERPRPDPAASLPTNAEEAYGAAVEAELTDLADSLLTKALLDGLDACAARRWMIRPTCDHHLAFGHGAIYTQKAFELLEQVGWEHAVDVLPHLCVMHTVSTREDRLPYMRPFLRALEASGIVARSTDVRRSDWEPSSLVAVLLGSDQTTAVGACAAALDDGAGLEGVLDAVVLAASERLLRHDVAFERTPDVSGYGWLDITHSLTYANAARWAFGNDPGPHTARLVMYTVFHVVDGGRYVTNLTLPTLGPATMTLVDALRVNDSAAAVAAALFEPAEQVGAALVAASLDDRSGALIVVAHHVKTVRAAINEARFTGSSLPLAAAARFLTSPARQRFVGNAVRRATHFLTTGTPPPR